MHAFTKGFLEKAARSKNYRKRVLAILFDDNGKILTGKAYGKRAIPGGGIDSGENIETAALRELKEETGFSCEDIKKLNVKPVKTEIKTNKDGKEYDGTITYFTAGKKKKQKKKDNTYGSEGDKMKGLKFTRKEDILKALKSRKKSPFSKLDEQTAEAIIEAQEILSL